MKSKRSFLVLGIGYLIFSAILYYCSSKVVDKRLSIVELNDIVCTIKENVNSEGEMIKINKQGSYKLEELTRQYQHTICVIDMKDNVVYKTKGKSSTTIAQAYEAGDTVLDIDIEGIQRGCVLVSNHSNKMDSQIKNILHLVIASGIFVIICLTIYSSYIEKNIIMPFHKLNMFAKDVAAGNLDAPLVMDRGNVFGAFTESFDIMREQLSIARQNEKKANQSKKELVASLSHDIKTPLASIKALAEVLLVTISEEKQLDKIRSIEKKAIQIEELTNNLFHSTLEELQIIKVETKEEESRILDDMLSRVDYQHRIDEIIIPECLILCDKLRLEQVLDNIIFNSYKYANTDITLRSRIVDNYLELCFSDHGPGVDEKELPLLMQKYYRGSNAEGKNGAGIGLYMAQYFMNKMQGMLTVNNTSDGFEVRIHILLVN